MLVATKWQDASDLRTTLYQFIRASSGIAHKRRKDSWVQTALLVLYFGNNLQMCAVGTYVESPRHIDEEGANQPLV